MSGGPYGSTMYLRQGHTVRPRAGDWVCWPKQHGFAVGVVESIPENNTPDSFYIRARECFAYEPTETGDGDVEFEYAGMFMLHVDEFWLIDKAPPVV